MRLRWRVRLAIGVSTIAVLGTISWAVYSIFSAAEVRELDRELLARVQHEAENIEHSEGLMTIVHGTSLRIGALDERVKYAALYDTEGKLVARSATFDDLVPPYSQLHKNGARPFDFVYAERHLRGVLWPVVDSSVHPSKNGELLLAASREELDGDLESLSRLLTELFAFGSGLSILAAGWIARRLTRSIEYLASVAQRIGTGALDTRVASSQLDGSPEVRALGSEMNHMLDSLQSALATQQRFVSNAAHELRSPLTALLGELELALRRDRSAQEYKTALGEVLESVHALQRLAEDLLDLAKGRASAAARGESGAGNLAHVVELALEAVDHRRVKLVVDAPPVTVRGFERDLARLFRNLIENALAHAPDKSQVRVQTRPGDRDVIEVVVEDDGPGVADAMRARIFEPFVRGGEERTRSGAGLGLAIAREIAASSGATIALESAVRPTRFVVRLKRG